MCNNLFLVCICFFFLENLKKTPKKSVVLSTSSSIDIVGSIDRLHCALAPLASSETFSDVVSISQDDPPKKSTPVKNDTSSTEKNTNRIIKDNDFDSLEILFDFPSTDLTNDPQTDTVRKTENPCRIRFSETTRSNNTTKVYC